MALSMLSFTQFDDLRQETATDSLFSTLPHDL
jgi:hypothetical protein